jgi:hypothetical protein
MTDAELRQYLVTKFNLWKTEIVRLLKRVAPIVKHADNTLKINGYSLADLIAIIKGEVGNHTSQVRPHGETLAQLGGMTTATFDAQAVNYFPKDAVPLTKIPAPAGSFTSATIYTPNSLDIVFYGRKIRVPTGNVTLSGTARMYLKIVVTGIGPAEVASFVISTNANEDSRNMVVGWFDWSGSAWVPSFIRTVRIGTAVLSSTVRGNGIPHSSGTQAAAGSVPTTWFQ